MRNVPSVIVSILFGLLCIYSTDLFADRPHGHGHANVFGFVTGPGFSVGFGSPGPYGGGYYAQPFMPGWPGYGTYYGYGLVPAPIYNQSLPPPQTQYQISPPTIINQVLYCREYEEAGTKKRQCWWENE